MAALVLASLLTALPAAAGGFAAGAITNFTTVAGPRAVVTGDVNNDGILDMVVPGASGSGISVLRGLGNGAFAPAQSFPANASGVPVLADFNLDGKLDIAVPLTSLGAVQFYNGNGDGTFTSGNSMSTPPNAECLATADFNGDGKPDVATCGNTTVSTGSVRVYLNTTTTPGNFETFNAVDVAVGAQPRGIAVGFNLFGTGQFDLVTANQSAGSVSLLKNNGAGTFGNRLDVATQKSCYAVAVGALWPDPNPSVRPQIVTANKDSAAVSMIAYDTNTSAWVAKKFATAADPRSISLGDADGNGNLDVIVSALNSNVVSVLSTNFDGTGNWLKPHVDIAVGSHPWSASVVNFDGDSKPDLLVAVNGNNRVSWVHGAPKVGWALGDTIPAFASKNQYDDTFSSSALAGKWTLLEFCSGWCTPCRFLMAPVTQNAWWRWYHHPSVSFEYVTALIDGDVPGTPSTLQDAMGWANQYGISRPVLHSSDLPGGGVLMAAHDAENYWTPSLRLIDPAGRVVWLEFGAVDDSTIARVVANAAGVEIPLELTAKFYGGTETVTSGAQQVSSNSDPSSGFTFPFYVTGFGENFTSDFLMTRHPNLTEDWVVDLTYWPFVAGQLFLPTTDSWQITLSNLQIDGGYGARSLPPGATAQVVATDTLGVDHVLQNPVSLSWVNGALTFGAIPAADLAALPPIRKLTLSLTMQITGWVAGVNDPAAGISLVMRAPWPNPARSASRIAWSQPHAGAARLDVYDVGGRHIRTVTDGLRPAGAHDASWDLVDAHGARVGAGLYFVRLSVAGETPRMQRITVLR